MYTNSENHEPTSVDNLHDRLLERGLAEVVGGETPPDLSEHILAGKRPSAHIVEERIRSRFGRRVWISLTVAAMLLLAAVPLLTSSVQVAREAAQSSPVSAFFQDQSESRPPTDAAPSLPFPSEPPLVYSSSDEWSELVKNRGTAAGSNKNGTLSSEVRDLGGMQDAADFPRFTNESNVPYRQNSFDNSKPGALPPPAGGSGQPGAQSQALPRPQSPDARRTLEQLGAEGMLGPVDVRFIEGSNIVIIRGREQDVAEVRKKIAEIESQSSDRNGDKSGQPVFVNGAQQGISNFENWYTTPAANEAAKPETSVSLGMAAVPVPVATPHAAEPATPGLATSAGTTESYAWNFGTGTQNGDGQRQSSDRLAAFDSAGKPVMLFKEFRGPQPWGLDKAKQQPEGTGPGLSGDQYIRIVENPFIKAEGGAAVSTFSIDVDTASYANVRRFLLTENTLPPPDAVRLEELINYFKYSYAPPKSAVGDDTIGPVGVVNPPAPFASHIEVAGCPWKPEHRLVRIGIKGAEMDRRERPKSNLVFLVDVSGSMNEPTKLPLVVDSLKELARELSDTDRVAIVVYAQQEGLVLPSTPGSERETIIATLDRLRAGGSTAGGAGIQLAYQIAEDNFVQGGTNRVILCTDGDFNVGTTSTAELERMVEQKAKDTKVFLSVLGFGRGNLNDQMMEAISNHGNGNYSYVDSLREARRVFVEEMSGTLVTIAKDVKIQVEFNPQQVAGYRLLGYENRMLRTEDFNDDTKDAGEIGAGHTVTALYEVVPAGKPVDLPPVDELKYQKRTLLEAASDGKELATASPAAADVSRELLTLKMKYKRPDAETSEAALEWAVSDGGLAFSAASPDFQFASAVAGFGMLLRGSQHKGNLTYAAAIELAQGGLGGDNGGYRAEFLDMVRRARQLRGE